MIGFAFSKLTPAAPARGDSRQLREHFIAQERASEDLSGDADGRINLLDGLRETAMIHPFLLQPDFGLGVYRFVGE